MKELLDQVPQPFTHLCPECQKPLRCDLEAGKSVCWCFSLPMSADNKASWQEGQLCLCRSCLTKALGALEATRSTSPPGRHS